MLWGLGDHGEREKWIDYFNLDTGQSFMYEAKEPLDKQKVLKQIEEDLKQKYEVEQTERGKLFELLSDIGDDDGASVMLDDMNFDDYSYMINPY